LTTPRPGLIDNSLFTNSFFDIYKENAPI